MTLTISLNQVGIVRATELLHRARNDAARLHETEPRTVSVEVDRKPDAENARVRGLPTPQQRIVDLQI